MYCIFLHPLSIMGFLSSCNGQGATRQSHVNLQIVGHRSSLGGMPVLHVSLVWHGVLFVWYKSHHQIGSTCANVYSGYIRQIQDRIAKYFSLYTSLYPSCLSKRAWYVKNWAASLFRLACFMFQLPRNCTRTNWIWIKNDQNTAHQS